MKKEFKILTKSDYPVVCLNIMGEDINFLIDSGANISMIDMGCDRFKGRIVGMNGSINDSICVTESNSNPMFETFVDEIGPHCFMAYNIDMLRNATAAQAGVMAEGIIGSDFLWKYKGVIDYVNNTLTLEGDDVPIQ